MVRRAGEPAELVHPGGGRGLVQEDGWTEQHQRSNEVRPIGSELYGDGRTREMGD